MHNIRLRVPATLATLLIACGVQAQNLKPGLWEMRSQMQGGSGEMATAMADMQKQMAAMPPEQRKQMQDMLAKQGMRMDTTGGGGMQIKMCLTKEMVERNEIPAQDGSCKTTYSPRSGNTMKVSFVCTTPPSSGEGEMRFISAEAYSSKMTVNSSAKGKAESMTVTSDGKWQSAECGAIKPLGAKAK